MRTMIAGLLASTAILRMMADESGAGTLDRAGEIKRAVDRLDDAEDTHWLEDGRPRMEAVELFFGDTTPTREEVEAVGRVRGEAPKTIAIGDPGSMPSSEPVADPDVVAAAESERPADPGPVLTDPQPAPAVAQQTVSKGRIVFLTLAEAIEGEFEIAGVVAKVNEDGSINVRGVSPGGGVDPFFSGVLPTEYVDAMIDGSAEKNGARTATWHWPPRT